MEEYIDKIDIQNTSMQTLAFIGDAIYNVYIRTYLASKSNMQTGKLHKQSISYVSARAQSKIVESIYDTLSSEEQEIFKRGRNTNIPTVSKNVDVISYKKATGYEALLGYLYITKNTERLEQVIQQSIHAVENN